MGKVDYKKDWKYARSRLKDSLILVEGAPFACHDINLKDGRLSGKFILGNRYTDFSDNIYLEASDFSPMKLGYVNVGRVCGYSFRLPVRYYKQGLTQNTFLCKGAHTNIFSKELAYTIIGKFPSIISCAESITNEEVDATAFCRDFSLSAKGKDGPLSFGLSFRGKPVGVAYYNSDNGNMNLQLKQNFTFLEETLGEYTNV